MAEAKTQPALTAQHKVGYTYKRTLGPILSRFFSGLREGKILGIRRSDGTVMVPPKEYDPDTGDALHELVDVQDTGIVRTFAWVHHPRAKQPLSRPFAYALIQLEGADTPLLHAVDAGEEGVMRTGMRVRARWSDDRVGAITDIACFVPAEGEGRK
jgi:uncharacterized protein